MKTGAEVISGFSLGARNSWLANSPAPPRRSEARSISSVKSIKKLSHKKSVRSPTVREGNPALAHARASDTSARAKEADREALQTRRHHKPSAREGKSLLSRRERLRLRKTSA